MTISSKFTLVIYLGHPPSLTLDFQNAPMSKSVILPIKNLQCNFTNQELAKFIKWVCVIISHLRKHIHIHGISTTLLQKWFKWLLISLAEWGKESKENPSFLGLNPKLVTPSHPLKNLLHSRIDYICTIFHKCEFSNVSLNCLLEPKQSHIERFFSRVTLHMSPKIACQVGGIVT